MASMVSCWCITQPKSTLSSSGQAKNRPNRAADVVQHHGAGLLRYHEGVHVPAPVPIQIDPGLKALKSSLHTALFPPPWARPISSSRFTPSSSFSMPA